MSGQLFCVISAGGFGERLHPVSRESFPKQLLRLNDDYTLFQRAFLNAANLVNDKNIISSVNMENVSAVRLQLETMQEFFSRKTPYKTIIEPVQRNTAPAVSIAAKYINDSLNDFYAKYPVILAVPSDEIFADREILAKTLEQGIALAQNGYIVSFGIRASVIENGRTYFKIKNSAAASKFAESAVKVSEYIKEPSKEYAVDLADAKIFENTGLYMFRYDVYLNELKKYEKELYLLLENISIEEGALPSIPLTQYENMPDVSIEEAVIEKTKKLAMLPLDSEYTNLDSWDELYNTMEKDENGNCYAGNVLASGCENSMIISSGKTTAVIGAKDMIIAASEDGSLVCARKNAGGTRKIYEKLKEKRAVSNEVNKTVCRPWGYYTVLENGEGFLTKCITVNPKAKLSLQKHFHRSEHWIILEGEAYVIKGAEVLTLQEGESADIDIEEVHSLQNKSDKPLKILEVQMGDVIDENDIERLSDIYGRVKV